jgi:hypothetical protein
VPRDPATWYILINEQQTGPLTRVELGVELASGAISGDSLVWKDGMGGWVPGAKVPELAALFRSPPKSPRASLRAQEKPRPPERGAGINEFDTAHFRLADVAPGDTGTAASRQMEFDTAHFKLAELAPDDDGTKRDLEFDTARFRLAELKGSTGARAAVPKRIAPKGMEARPPRPSPSSHPVIKSKLKQASTAARPMPPPVDEIPLAVPRPSPAAKPPPPARPAARPPPAKAPAVLAADFDPRTTSVDFLAYGEQVHQQQVAQDLFESVAGPEAPSANAHELGKLAAEEMAKEQSPAVRAPSRPPPVHIPLPPRKKSAAPVWFAVGGGVVALLVVLFLLFGD